MSVENPIYMRFIYNYLLTCGEEQFDSHVSPASYVQVSQMPGKWPGRPDPRGQGRTDTLAEHLSAPHHAIPKRKRSK